MVVGTDLLSFLETLSFIAGVYTIHFVLSNWQEKNLFFSFDACDAAWNNLIIFVKKLREFVEAAAAFCDILGAKLMLFHIFKANLCILLHLMFTIAVAAGRLTLHVRYAAPITPFYTASDTMYARAKLLYGLDGVEEPQDAAARAYIGELINRVHYHKVNHHFYDEVPSEMPYEGPPHLRFAMLTNSPAWENTCVLSEVKLTGAPAPGTIQSTLFEYKTPFRQHMLCVFYGERVPYWGAYGGACPAVVDLYSDFSINGVVLNNRGIAPPPDFYRRATTAHPCLWSSNVYPSGNFSAEERRAFELCQTMPQISWDQAKIAAQNGC